MIKIKKAKIKKAKTKKVKPTPACLGDSLLWDDEEYGAEWKAGFHERHTITKHVMTHVEGAIDDSAEYIVKVITNGHDQVKTVSINTHNDIKSAWTEKGLTTQAQLDIDDDGTVIMVINGMPSKFDACELELISFLCRFLESAETHKTTFTEVAKLNV